MMRLAIAAAIGLPAALITGALLSWAYAPAVGWDAAAMTYCAVIWIVIWPMDAADTAALAGAEDPNRATADLITLGACVASLAAVGLVLVGAHSAHGAAAEALAGLGLASVAISWFTVHTIFALRYALLYYADQHGGVSFNQQEPPCYRDFCYLSLRRQALLSYLFGTVVLAATINLIAGLGSSGSIG